MKSIEPSQIHRDVAKFALRHVCYWLILMFMVAGGAILVMIVATMIKEQAPLVINAKLTAWAVSIGFLVLTMSTIAVGLAVQWWGLRFCRGN